MFNYSLSASIKPLFCCSAVTKETVTCSSLTSYIKFSLVFIACSKNIYLHNYNDGNNNRPPRRAFKTSDAGSLKLICIDTLQEKTLSVLLKTFVFEVKSI